MRQERRPYSLSNLGKVEGEAPSEKVLRVDTCHCHGAGLIEIEIEIQKIPKCIFKGPR